MHIRRLELKGRFPSRVRLGECRAAWLTHEVEEWIQSRLSAGTTAANDA
jgi:prophage regulatory protein